MITRAKWVAGLATLILTSASSGVAQGNVSVAFRNLPTRVVAAGPMNRSVRITVFAEEPATTRKGARLAVFSSTVPCPATASAEKRTSHVVIDVNFHGGSTTREGPVLPEEGTTYLCAYVYEVKTHTLAHAWASLVTSGKGGSYGVTLSAPESAVAKEKVKFNLRATAPVTTELTVFSSSKHGCEPTFEREQGRGMKVLNTGGEGEWNRVGTFEVQQKGTYRLCAYLYGGSRSTRDHTWAFGEASVEVK
jgi:hypothetical protein